MAVPRSTSELIEKFAQLFQGNIHRYGTEHGGSVGMVDTWFDLCHQHLTSGEPIGAYPIDPRTGRVRWGCVDFDEGETESFRHAYRLEYFLAECGISSAVERSRSKGYHVWVFCRGRVPAKTMRHALLYACEFVGAPTKEVNPKQEQLADGQLGNYVRLPYPGHWDPRQLPPQGKRVIIDTQTGRELSLEQFISFYDTWLNPREDIEALAAWYKPKPQHKHSAYTLKSSYDSPEELIAELRYSERRLFERGPKNADRSTTLCALAGAIARGQVDKDPSKCLVVLEAADRRWGKYSTRNDSELRLVEIVERAYRDLDSY